MKNYRCLLATLLCLSLLAACGGRAYVHGPLDNAALRDRAETQTEGPVLVSAAVPGRDETTAIFGLPLYDQGIQPVWIEIENGGANQARYALSSTDRLYFSPNEVAYKNRGGYSDDARTAMEKRFDELGITRHVPAGETRSGFVFTHADTGAKGFNVDVFSGGDMYSFTYLLRVPGFVPDYANLDFDSIYAADQVDVHQGDDLVAALKSLPCCSDDADGEANGEPVNVILVGAGNNLLRALLRSRWIETSIEEAASGKPTYLFGRPQDAIFRYHSATDDSYYELRTWLAPVMAGEDRVWAGQVRHFFKRSLALPRVDPDVDNARNFALQNFLYSQALQKIGWLSGREVVPVESFWENLITKPFFTDGYRIVVWLSPEPLSLLDVGRLKWEDPPGWKQ